MTLFNSDSHQLTHSCLRVMSDKPSVGGILLIMKPVKNPQIEQKVGRLVLDIIEQVYYQKNRIKNVGHFTCDCGNRVSFPVAQFGNKTSCGCKEKDRIHRKCKTSIYNIWTNIKTRCNCETYKQYPDYGGRGIKMCGGFKKFLYFESFMGERPSNRHSIDRIDNDGWYCCGECEDCLINGRIKNVRWATPKEQSENKRTNLYLNYKGEKLCLSEVARRCGIPQPVLHQRIVKLKWNVDEAVSIPVKRDNRFIKRGNIGRNQFSKI